jgi:cytochrome b
VIGLLLFRLIWGFVGPAHARFGHFLPGPRAFLAYLRTVAQRDSKPSVGHNPMGAVMVVVMLLMVATQAFTGLFTSDDIVWAGPFFPSVSAKLSTLAGSIHHRNFAILQWILGLHVLAILVYKFYKRQPLVSAMVHGHKSADVVPADQQISSSRLLLAVVVALAVAGAVYWVISQAPPPAELSY